MNTHQPFASIEALERDLVRASLPTHDLEIQYQELCQLLTDERDMETERIEVLTTFGYDSDISQEFLYRERLMRHQISVHALTLDKRVTNRIDGNDRYTKSAVAICIFHREPYPEPVKQS